MNYTGSFAFKTDPGKMRDNNEDQAMVLVNGDREVLLLVADGMGGGRHGEVASKLAIDTISALFAKKKKPLLPAFNRRWLANAAKKANEKVFASSESNRANRGMGTTLVAALLSEEHCFILNVGDSRAYFITPDEIRQMTEDETYVNYLVRSGKISEKEALTHPDRHVVMNALGIHPTLSYDLQDHPYAGETILLCSDGLYNECSATEIQTLCLTDERSDQKVRSLIVAANGNGGNDNIGVSLWEVLNND